MSAMLWRVLWAVLCVVVFYAILPPFLRIIGFTPDADVMLIVRIAVAALALFYVFKGPPVWPPR